MKTTWLSIIVLVIIEVLAEILLHKWSVTNTLVYLVGGVAAYNALAYVFAHTIKDENLAFVNTAWQCLNIVLVSLFGVLISNEKLTVRNWIGVCLGCIAAMLMF